MKSSISFSIVCMAAVPSLMLVAPSLTLAQPVVSGAEDPLDVVAVTATRTPRSLRDSAADVVVLDARTLQEGGLASVEDALRQHAGLQLARNGGPGQSAGYFLRGSGSSGTVVLIDGIRVGSATLGQFEFSSLALSQVDRIEVLRGPASSLYGADAVGGVINIITRRGQVGKPQLGGNLALGNHRSAEASVGLRGAEGAFDYALDAGHERSRGVSAIRPDRGNSGYNPDDDGFRRTVGTMNLGWTPVEGHRLGLLVSRSRLNAQYDAAEYPAPDFVADASPDFRNHLDTSVLAVDHAGSFGANWQSRLRLARTVDESQTGGRRLSRFETRRRQLGWQNEVQVAPQQQLLLALEHLREEVSADSYTRDERRSNKAAVLGYAGGFGPASLEASVRRDDNSAYGKNTTGTLGGSLWLADAWKLRALVGKTFRAPTFNDLYYPNYGVASLRPEKGRSAELGLSWQQAAHDASITVYRNKVRDLIGYDPDSTGTTCPAGQFGCAANTSKARLQGATLAAGTRHGNWQLRANVDFLDARDEDTGQRLNRRAAHQGSVSVDHDAGAWQAGATLTRVGSRPDGDTRLGAYAQLDLRASWRVDARWRLEARVFNVTDRDIEPVLGYQDPGRQFWLGLRWLPGQD